jgi:hypothetical protein
MTPAQTWNYDKNGGKMCTTSLANLAEDVRMEISATINIGDFISDNMFLFILCLQVQEWSHFCGTGA